jgi:flagellar protein FlaI
MGESNVTFEETEKESKKTRKESSVRENHTFSRFRRLIRKMKRGLNVYKGARRVLAGLRRPRFSINPLKTKPKTKPLTSQLKASPNSHKSTSSHAQPLTFKEFYPVNAPYGYVGIDVDKETGRFQYLTVEPTMDEHEKQTLRRLKTIIKEEANVPLSVLKDEALVEDYLTKQIKRAIKTFKLDISEDSVEKFIYYMKRDFLGYGIIDVLIRDPNIEDISCDGTAIPIYVWHRYHESIPTNVKYYSKEELDAFITRLAYKAGHQISVSRPILEGALPEGFRVHLTLEEISKRGDTFTIRKVRANPFTVIDLIKFGTISPHMAAYFWILIENSRSLIVAGATASGKTALLNSISTFIRPEMKVITIEEVRELRLHENWIPMVTRPSFQKGIQEVTLFDLLKSSLRQRPDYIVVGEVRGEEAYTLFQSISVGHGGLCTIHAENVETVEKRLLTKPMNIPPMLIPMMNVIVLIRRTKLHETTVRRVLNVSEITGVDDKTRRANFKKVYEWDSGSDSFIFDIKSGGESHIFKRISELKHVQMETLSEELKRREYILKWMAQKNMESCSDVADVVRRYYLNPDDVYNMARLET